MLKELITPERPYWDRADTVGASEITACAKRISYLKHGQQADGGFDDSGWGYTERGHHVERWVVEQLGDRIVHSGKAQFTRTDGFLSATPDGRVGTTSIDVKSFDPRKDILDFPLAEHVVQVRLGARLDPDATEGVLLYVNCSDYSDMHEYGPFPQMDDEEFASLKDRARLIVTRPPDDHEREGVLTEECSKFSGCPFRTACTGAAVEGKGRLSLDQLHEIQTIREDYRQATKAMDEASHSVNQLKERVRTIFRNADVTTVKGKASVARRIPSAGNGAHDVVTIR